jgi:hypothetical protein
VRRGSEHATYIAGSVVQVKTDTATANASKVKKNPSDVVEEMVCAARPSTIIEKTVTMPV